MDETTPRLVLHETYEPGANLLICAHLLSILCSQYLGPQGLEEVGGRPVRIRLHHFFEIKNFINKHAVLWHFRHQPAIQSNQGTVSQAHGAFRQVSETSFPFRFSGELRRQYHRTLVN
jgi:hypothetical protein